MKRWVLPLAALGCWVSAVDCGSSFHAAPSDGPSGDAGAAEAGEAGAPSSEAGAAGELNSGGAGGDVSGAGSGGTLVAEGGSLGVGGVGGASGPTIASSSNAYAVALCARYAACLPAQFSGYYSSQDNCVRASQLTVVASFALPGNGITPASLTKCAADRGAQTCAAFNGQKPASCLVAGKLAAGAACNASSQCASTFCNLEDTFPDHPCGVCEARVGLGAACKRDGCTAGAGLSCVYGADNKRTCQLPLAEGVTCDNNSQCANDLRCLNQACAKMPGVGETCEAIILCRDGEGEQCITDASDMKTCVKATFGNPGDACDYSKAQNCMGASACIASPSGTGNVCSPIAKLGQACDATSNPCELPYVCTSAKCVAPTPVAACQ